MEQAGDSAKDIQKLLSEVQHALSGKARAQQQCQQFYIAQCTGTASQQFFAWARVRWKVFQGHERGDGRIF